MTVHCTQVSFYNPAGFIAIGGAVDERSTLHALNLAVVAS